MVQEIMNHPRADHYRKEFAKRKESSNLIRWMLDEFEQEEERLNKAQERLKNADNAIMVACERALYDDAIVLKLEDTLTKAVEVIKQWHNMGGAEAVWQIYYDNAPETQPIRDALKPRP